MDYSKKSYSQDGEDVVLASFYEETPDYRGTYVDIGAFHPLRYSNTQYFYERGWRGINIDATPGSMAEFKIHRPEDINLEIGISNSKHPLTFYQFKEPALNSFNADISKQRQEKGWDLINTVQIRTKSINDVLKRFIAPNQTIDFINIDLEGLDLDVLMTLNWELYAPKFFLVEDLDGAGQDVACALNSQLTQIMSKRGYVLVAKTKRTAIFSKCLNANHSNFFGNAVDKLKNILLYERGLVKSIEQKKPIDAENKPLPWYTYPAIDFLSDLNFAEKRVFEYGSGYSSVYWSERASKVISIEDNLDWFLELSTMIPSNCRLLYKKNMNEYITAISQEKDMFDVIIIDGKYRDLCANEALKMLAPNGMIILDNSDRVSEFEEYERAIQYLRSANLIQIDFSGFGPGNAYTWSTSCFFTRNFDFVSNIKHQPTKKNGTIHEK